MSLYQKDSRERVTALKFVVIPGVEKLFMCEGSGSYIYIYHLESNSRSEQKPLASAQVLHGSVIHGIVQSEHSSKLTIYGQKSMAIVNLKYNDDGNLIIERLGNVLSYNDWIWDLVWYSDDKFVIITAHNRLLLVNAGGDVLQEAACEVNCILYSAKILRLPLQHSEPQNLSNITVAAGTVFNKVLIWCVRGGDSTNVLHTLTGHRGVIFNINLNYNNNCISTVSDDRTCRVWSWKDNSRERQSQTDNEWEHSVFTPLCVCEGHSARVWQSLLFNQHIITIGEDCEIKCWDYSGKLLNSTAAHRGKNIWSIDHYKEQYILTGSADCSVKLWSANHILPNYHLYTKSCLHIEPGKPETGDGIPTDFPRRLFLLDDVCLMVSDQGFIYTYNLKTGILLKLVHELKRKTNDLCTEVIKLSSPDKWCLLMGDYNGQVIVLVYDQKAGSFSKEIALDIACKSKLLSILKINGSSDNQALCTDVSGVMYLLDIIYTNGINDLTGNVQLRSCVRLSLPKSKIRCPTCICKLNYTQAQSDNSMYVCGDRSGSILLYIVPNYWIQEDTDPPLLPVHSLYKIHGEGGVSELSSHDVMIYSIGRDGTVRSFLLSEINQLVLINIHKVNASIDWLCGFYQTSHESYIAAFHTSRFVLLDDTLEQPVFSVECGGGYRNWILKLTEGGERDRTAVKFIYIKDKAVHQAVKTIISPYKTIQAMYHGCKITSSLYFTFDEVKFILTCGDNSTIIISRVESCRTSPVCMLEGHISNVKCCCHVLTQDHDHLLFTGGGRGQLCGWQIMFLDHKQVPVVRYLGSVRVSEIYSSHTRRRKKTTVEDPDMRIMSLQSLTSNNHTVTTISACSDGLIRTVKYDLKTNKFHSITNRYTHTHCLLTSMLYQSGTNQTVPNHTDDLYLVTATDGLVLIFKMDAILLQDAPQPIISLRQHQSGINSLYITSLPHVTNQSEDSSSTKSQSLVQSHKNIQSDRPLLLVTGGDDNAVVFQELERTTLNPLKCKRFNSIHSAQVTGIAGVGDYILSASIDQRLHVYKYVPDEWTPVYTKYTTISDVSSITSCDDLVLVIGEGLSLMQLSEATS